MEYTKHIAKVYNLVPAEIIQLKKLFIEGINSDMLHDSESVHYEQETGTILKIVNLQRDSDSGEFYVASGHKPKSASPSMTRHHIQKVKPLAFNQLRLKIEHT